MDGSERVVGPVGGAGRLKLPAGDRLRALAGAQPPGDRLGRRGDAEHGSSRQGTHRPRQKPRPGEQTSRLRLPRPRPASLAPGGVGAAKGNLRMVTATIPVPQEAVRSTRRPHPTRPVRLCSATPPILRSPPRPASHSHASSRRAVCGVRGCGCRHRSPPAPSNAATQNRHGTGARGGSGTRWQASAAWQREHGTRTPVRVRKSRCSPSAPSRGRRAARRRRASTGVKHRHLRSSEVAGAGPGPPPGGHVAPAVQPSAHQTGPARHTGAFLVRG